MDEIGLDDDTFRLRLTPSKPCSNILNPKQSPLIQTAQKATRRLVYFMKQSPYDHRSQFTLQ